MLTPKDDQLTTSDYDRTAYAIACVVYALCDDEGEGSARNTHFNSNNLQAPCDMLARLGIMTDEGTSHVFTAGWMPGKPLAIARHPGEPRASDLLLALGFYARWFPSHTGTSRTHTDPMPSTKLSDGDWIGGRADLLGWAMRRVVECLEDFNFGERDEAGDFKLCYPCEDVLRIEYYWQSRATMSQHVFGGEAGLFPGRPVVGW